MKAYSILQKSGQALIIEAEDIEAMMVKYHKYGNSEKDILSTTVIKPLLT